MDVNDKGGKYCDFCPLKYIVKIVPKSVFPSLLCSKLLEQQVGFRPVADLSSATEIKWKSLNH